MAVMGKIEMFTTPGLMEELKRVLTLKFSHRAVEIAGTLAELALLWTVIPSEKLPEISAIQEDPDDNLVLACAIAAKAEVIVSGDNHLKKLGAFRAIPIVPPREFLNRFFPHPPQP